MKERPILFSGEMVRAILDGRKTQTRRLLKADAATLAILDKHTGWVWHGGPDGYGGASIEVNGGTLSVPLRCPYGVPGDRLWVRETWSHDAESIDACRAAHEDACASVGYGPYYRATEVSPDTLKWHPGIFMPRWASRITLEVTDVRVQRLQEIDGEDAAAEGIAVPRCGCEVCSRSSIMCPADASAHIEEFATLWDSINGRDGRRWSDNPFVWAISFRRVEAR